MPRYAAQVHRVISACPNRVLALLMAILCSLASTGAAGGTFGDELFNLIVSDDVDIPGVPIDSLPDDPTVAVSGNMALLGVAHDDVGGGNSGAAYLFDVTTGTLQRKLKASDARWGANFGASVSIHGNIAAVGAPVEGYGPGTGAVYFFDTSTGAELMKLTVSEKGDDNFGQSVDIYGDWAIVGAPGVETVESGGVMLSILGTGPFRPGLAYFIDVTTTGQVWEFSASDGRMGDQFGRAVAIDAERAIVSDVDSAYVFDIATGQELWKLTSSDGDVMGESLDLRGDLAIIGSPYSDDSGPFSGAAYLFDVTTGRQLNKLRADDAEPHSNFGSDVALDGDLAFVGSPGTNRAQAPSPGAVYVFDVTTKKQLAKLTASGGWTGDRFGSSVATDDGRAAVVLPYEQGSEDTVVLSILDTSYPSLLPGDANLDHSFDQLDIVQVLQAGKYLTRQPATWGDGDWDGGPSAYPAAPPAGDGFFDQLDIRVALHTGAYLSGPYGTVGSAPTAVAAVPEPTSVASLLLGVSAIGVWQSSRKLRRRPREQTAP